MEKVEEAKEEANYEDSFSDDENDEKSPSIELEVRKDIEEVIYFRAKKVILAAGGQQSLPDDIKLLGIRPKIDKYFFTSDEVLKKQGFIRLLNYIKENNVKEISIIGGSHSGLSCVWMLLNGSAMHDFNENDPHDFNLDLFDPEKKDTIFKKQFLRMPKECRKYKNYLKNEEKLGGKDESSELGEEFEYESWPIGGILTHPDFSHIRIKIICKGDIKVWYKSKDEAALDGYTNYTKNCVNSKGTIYPFTGLRGDAKQLWRRIKVLKSEDQIEFVRANNCTLQKNAIK